MARRTGAPGKYRRIPYDPNGDRVLIVSAGVFVPSGSWEHGGGHRQESTTP